MSDHLWRGPPSAVEVGARREAGIFDSRYAHRPAMSSGLPTRPAGCWSLSDGFRCGGMALRARQVLVVAIRPG